MEQPSLTDTPDVRVLLPDDPLRGVRGELNLPVAIRLVFRATAKTAKPRGLTPAVLHTIYKERVEVNGHEVVDGNVRPISNGAHDHIRLKDEKDPGRKSASSSGKH